MSVKLVKRAPQYSPVVKARLKADRPKYSEAVKALAAFAPDERKFNVLVAHLDAVWTEARRHFAQGPERYLKSLQRK
jgi:hypothetical protein